MTLEKKEGANGSGTVPVDLLRVKIIDYIGGSDSLCQLRICHTTPCESSVNLSYYHKPCEIIFNCRVRAVDRCPPSDFGAQCWHLRVRDMRRLLTGNYLYCPPR